MDDFVDFESYDVPEPEYTFPNEMPVQDEVKEETEGKAEAETSGPGAQEPQHVGATIPLLMRTLMDEKTKRDVQVPDPFQFRALPILDFLSSEPPAYDFVIPGLLAGTVGGIVAAGGGSKTTFMLEVAVAVATAEAKEKANPLGIQVKKAGKVIFFSAEDAGIVIHHRLREMGRDWSPEVAKAVAENLVVIDCVGDGVDMSDSLWEERLTKTCEGARLVVFDTLTRMHSLDENQAKDAKVIMAVLERIAKKTGAACVFCHHVSKASALQGLAELQQAARGSSVFVDNARWLAFLVGMTIEEANKAKIDEETRKRIVKYNVSKQNYSGPVRDTWYARGDGGILYPPDVPLAISISGISKATAATPDKSTPRRRVSKGEMERQGQAYARVKGGV